MIKITKSILISLLIAISMLACSDDAVEATPTLNVAEPVVNFTNATAIKTVKVNTNQTDWTAISSDSEWCRVTARTTASSNEVEIMVTENDKTNSRSAEIVVSAKNLKSTIKVEQMGSAPIIMISPDSLYLQNRAMERTLKITTNIETVLTEIPTENDWISIKENQAKKGEYIVSVTDNKTYDERKGNIIFKSANPAEKISEEFMVTQKGLEGTSADVEVPKDIKVVPTGGKANQEQPGQGIKNSYDGVFGGTPYHSPWGNGTNMPVILEYFFDGKGKAPELIDYLVYYTRSGNGNFGKVNIYVATTEKPQYELYEKYDFRETNSPTKINFTDGLKNPTKIKFEVLSGLGGYASCDEMEFYQINNDNNLIAEILSVFTDTSCSELKKGVTDEQISKINPFFGTIAKNMKKNEYPREFRIAEYPAYSNLEMWAEKLMINPRGVLDNCTGIYAEANEEVVILVGKTNGNQLQLRSIEDTNFFGDDYMLNEGINKIKMRKKGLLYILYNVNDIQAPASKPIKIHIPMQSGIVNGYWDIKEHKTDEKYKELLAKATYPYFEIKGTDMMLKFHINRLRELVPSAIIPSINFWDEMVQVEQSIMGLEGIYPEKMNNRMYARSMDDGYMSAQSYQTNFAENILWKILSPKVMLQDEDNPWGPAHEIGHMNQGAINWEGNTETSNNLFSNVVRYKMTHFPSRGEGMDEINIRNVVEKKIFAKYGQEGFYDDMPSLRMQWQLYCYFNILDNNQEFFPNLFKFSRQEGRRPIHNKPGWSNLNYVRNACDAAQLNLLDFFDFWGFLAPAEMTIKQYGTAQLSITQAMIDETISYVERKGYKKPAQVIQYIEDRDDAKYGNVGKMNKQYKEISKITKNVTYTRSGNTINIQNGDQAIGFEVKEGNALKFYSNKYSFSIDKIGGWNRNFKVFAVQADGVRKELTTN